MKYFSGRSQGRYTGTDQKYSRIEENRALDAISCQKKCQNHPECSYFLFFDGTHYQTFKHLTCRLLRYKGDLKPDVVGHISGPKFCTEFDLADLQSNLQSNNFIQDLQKAHCNSQLDCKDDEELASTKENGDASADVIIEDDLTKMNDLKRRHAVQFYLYMYFDGFDDFGDFDEFDQ